jgi:CheY-like chemotaxis protein
MTDAPASTAAENSQPAILVADDSSTNRLMLEGVLETAQRYQVTTAAGGAEALAILEERTFELIILDVKMPEIDGFEVCRRIKRDPRLEKTPVIFVTALTDTINRMEGYKAGGIDYIFKPVDGEELLERVALHIDTHMKRMEQLALLDQLVQ